MNAVLMEMKEELEESVAELEAVLADPGFVEAHSGGGVIPELEFLVRRYQQLLGMMGTVIVLDRLSCEGSETETGVRLGEFNRRAVEGAAGKVLEKLKMALPYGVSEEHLAGLGLVRV